MGIYKGSISELWGVLGFGGLGFFGLGPGGYGLGERVEGLGLGLRV